MLNADFCQYLKSLLFVITFLKNSVATKFLFTLENFVSQLNFEKTKKSYLGSDSWFLLPHFIPRKA